MDTIDHTFLFLAAGSEQLLCCRFLPPRRARVCTHGFEGSSSGFDSPVLFSCMSASSCDSELPTSSFTGKCSTKPRCITSSASFHSGFAADSAPCRQLQLLCMALSRRHPIFHPFCVSHVKPHLWANRYSCNVKIVCSLYADISAQYPINCTNTQ